MTVKEKYNRFSESLLLELSEENSYWLSVQKFWESNKERLSASLTQKQLSWLAKIEEDLIIEAKKR